MAPIKCIDVTENVADIFRSLKTKYYEIIGHICLDKIKFVLVVYPKARSQEIYKDYGSCYAVDASTKLFMPDNKTCYIIEFIYNSVKRFDTNRLALLMLHELLHIPKCGMRPSHKDYLQTIDHDFIEFELIARLVSGVDWTDNNNTMIPHVIDMRKVKKIKISTKGIKNE